MFSQQEKLLFLQAWSHTNQVNYAKNQLTGDIMFFWSHQASYLNELLPAEFPMEAWATYHPVPGFIQIGENSRYAYQNKTSRDILKRQFKVLPQRTRVYNPAS